MKRFNLIATILLVASLSVNAQVLRVERDSQQGRPVSHRVQRKAASLDGTTPFGYGSTTDWEGLGINAVGASFDVAIYVPGGFNATINGINIPVLDEGMTKVSVWLRSQLSGKVLAKKEVSGTFVANEYFPVAFDEPIDLPAEGVYAGYSFTCSIAFPIAMGGDITSGGLYLNYTYNGSASGWGDYSDQFAPSALQVLLSNVVIPDYSIQLTSAGQSTQTANATYSIPVSLTSSSAKDIESLDVAVTINEETEDKHITLAQPIPGGINQKAQFAIEGTSPAQPGRYVADIVVKKVNGIDYEEECMISAQLKNLTRIVPRQTVIEEFTGTGCGYCPRGWVGMEYMKANYPESFVGIAFHKYNSSDPMYYENYPYLGLTGAPGCVIDRKAEADPYYGFGNDNLGIVDAFNLMNQELPEVDVRVAAQWNNDMTSVDIAAAIEFLIAPESLSLIYVLTADSLTSTATSWKQSNYYYQYTAAQVDNGPGLVDFCKNGKYGKSSVKLTFNDVVIGSSYLSETQNEGQNIFSDEGYKAGSIYQTTYSIPASTKAWAKSAAKNGHTDISVLVIDNTTGGILNARKVRVELPSAVIPVPSHNGTTNQTARYNAAGQAIATPQRGLNIIRMADGSVKKVMIK
ncbi:MAG: hypothetical protein J5671_00255 [Bacteroidaceae bacterium]|nr:hypothetical protein [Bacteroidaceae bacterium]